MSRAVFALWDTGTGANAQADEMEDRIIAAESNFMVIAKSALNEREINNVRKV